MTNNAWVPNHGRTAKAPRLVVRFSVGEWEQLQAAVKASGETMAAYVRRKLGLKATVVPPKQPERKDNGPSKNTSSRARDR